MFLVYLVLVCFLVFGLMMFHNYSVAMLVSIFVLYPFFVKISIKKSISLWIQFSVHILLLMVFSERFWNPKSYYRCYDLSYYLIYMFENDTSQPRRNTRKIKSCCVNVAALILTLQILSWKCYYEHRRTQNPVQHLRRSFFCENS